MRPPLSFNAFTACLCRIPPSFLSHAHTSHVSRFHGFLRLCARRHHSSKHKGGKGDRGNNVHVHDATSRINSGAIRQFSNSKATVGRTRLVVHPSKTSAISLISLCASSRCAGGGWNSFVALFDVRLLIPSASCQCSTKHRSSLNLMKTGSRVVLRGDRNSFILTF